MGNLKNLDLLLEKYVNDTMIAGAGLRVYRGSDCLYDRCLGYADAEEKKAFRPDTICQLASMTKCIAVAAGMQLYERGAFLLTDPVEKFIPEFADRKVYYADERGIIGTRPAKSPVTVGQLFDMTSGISVGWETPTFNGKEMSEGTQKLIAEGRYTVQEYAKLCGRVPGNFDPGEHFYYGDSHNIIGALIEVITGQTFGEFMKENIFDPLGMPDTFFKVP
ncbi:MAG: beta-lactamase family protein, partial [Lachnospiraceae bacterium]|nr:beta-lactamase family protein [Lachnospiraceae bacterium]